MQKKRGGSNETQVKSQNQTKTIWILLKSVKTTTQYKNTEGVVEIEIPDEMDADNGYVISNDDYTLEVSDGGFL